jgi:hypothetical protein
MGSLRSSQDVKDPVFPDIFINESAIIIQHMDEMCKSKPEKIKNWDMRKKRVLTSA